jgi:hypothetical protein
MANQQIEIKLVIAEEVSRQLSPIASEIKNIHAAAASGADRVHAGMGRLGGAVRGVHREFSSLTRLTLGGLVGGGVVAGIVAATKALGDMARQSQQLRYQAEALGTTPEFLERMSDGLTALGVDASTASRDVQSVISTLRDAEVHGRESSLFKALEHGVRGTGLKLWADIKRQMAGPEGAEGAFKYLIQRIENMPLSGQRAMLKALGISSLAFKDLKEVLPFVHKRIQLSADETRKLAIANANWQIEMGNVGRMLGSAIMPGLEKIMTALSKYLQTENGKKFAKEIGEWSNKIGEAVAKWIAEGGLQRSMEALGEAVTFLTTAFGEANEVITGIGTAWKEMIDDLVSTEFVTWLGDVAEKLGLLDIDILNSAGDMIKWLFGPNKRTQSDPGAPEVWRIDPNTGQRIPNAPPPPIPPELAPQPRFVPQGVPRPDPTSGEGKTKTDDERRADIELENRQRTALLTEMKGLTEEIGHVVDHFQIGGPEGTAGSSGFGAGVGGGFDVSSIIGRPGQTGKPWTFPKLPAGATSLSAIPGTQRPAQTEGTGFASWYGNRPDLGFRDSEDKGRQGVREQDQGIALGDPATLGKWFYITDPHTGTKHLTQQTDTGPNIRTQKLLDIHASQLERMGYTAKTFPSGRGLWNVARAPEGVEKPGFRSGAFDQVDDPIMAGLAGTGGGGGSATVDIDVGGLGQPARNPADLFKPQPLDGAIQMQNTTHEANNRLSFQ